MYESAGRIPTAASQPGGGSSSFGRAFLLTEEDSLRMRGGRCAQDDFLLGMSRRSPSGFAPPTGSSASHASDHVRGVLIHA